MEAQINHMITGLMSMSLIRIRIRRPFIRTIIGLEFCPLPIDTVPGCTDMLALNYVPEANFNDGSCEYPVFGCTNPEAPNFNPWAQADDNSCVGISCSEGEVKMIFEIRIILASVHMSNPYLVTSHTN